MYTFFVQHLPKALSHAMLQSLGQAMIIWLVLVLTGKLKALSATARYYLLSACTATLALLFAADIVVQTVKGYEGTSHWISNMTVAAADSFQPAGFSDYSTRILSILSPYIAIMYAIVLVLLAVRFTSSVRQTKQLHSIHSKKAPVDLRLFKEKYAAFLGISKKVSMYVSHRIVVPFTLGFIKPVILLPAALVGNLTPAQLEAIILHELIHIRRNDYLINMMLEISELLLFFNPFIRPLVHEARLYREISCDDHVLQFKVNPRTYAEALLTCTQQGDRSLALAANGESSFHLLNRIRRIMNNQQQQSAGGRLRFVPVFSLVIIISMLAFSTTWLPKNNKTSIALEQSIGDHSSDIYVSNGLSHLAGPLSMHPGYTPKKAANPMAEKPADQLAYYYYNNGWDIKQPQIVTVANEEITVEEITETPLKSISGEAWGANENMPAPITFNDANELANVKAAFVAETKKNMYRDRYTQQVIDHNRARAIAEAKRIEAHKAIIFDIDDKTIVLSPQELAQLAQEQQEGLQEAMKAVDAKAKALEEKIYQLSLEELKEADVVIKLEMAKVEEVAQKFANFNKRIRVEIPKKSFSYSFDTEGHQKDEESEGTKASRKAQMLGEVLGRIEEINVLPQQRNLNGRKVIVAVTL